MRLIMKRRPGRPMGPTEGRGKRPWDPRRLRPREALALDHVAANPDEPRWLVARRFGMSLSRLSVLTCSPAGQRYLAEAMSRLRANGLIDDLKE